MRNLEGMLILGNFRDCLVTTIVNSFTSFFSGFVIFTYLGYMSYKQGVDIDEVATDGECVLLHC